MFQIVDASCMDDNMEELASKVDVIFTRETLKRSEDKYIHFNSVLSRI